MTAGACVRHPRHRHVRDVLERRGPELIAAYKAGATVETVAAGAGIGATTLRRYLIAEGVPIRPRGGSRVRARLDAMNAELIAAYNAGVALAALAARAGVCPRDPHVPEGGGGRAPRRPRAAPEASA